MTATATAFRQGFSDPVDQGQKVFRAVLEAMSDPGRIHIVSASAERPDGVSAAATAVLLALADYSTPVWFDDAFSATDLSNYLKFHTGAPVAVQRSDACFALLGASFDPVLLEEFPTGSPEYPDRSATIIFDVPHFADGQMVSLTGPGIDGARHFTAPVLPPEAWPALIANSALFPLGLDFVFAAGNQIAALPRSTKIEVA